MLRSPLARTLDLKRPSNRVALAGFVGSALLARARGRSWPEAGAAGLTAFMAWSTARELDPDREGSANAALGLATLGAQLAPGRLPGAVTLNEGLRALAGTTGLRVTDADALALAGLALACALRGAGVLALTPAVALVLSQTVGDRLSPNERSVGLAALGALPAVLARPETRGAHPALRLAGALTLAVTASAREVAPVVSAADHGEWPVPTERVRLARALALGVLAGSVLLNGGSGLRHTPSLWAAWLGTWWCARRAPPRAI